MITSDLLVSLEAKFSPVVGAAPAVFSKHEKTRTDSMNAGGDKMGNDRNGYASVYARLLTGLTPRRIVELGVFQGVSMALWCHLFPDADVVGLDLDFDRFAEHRLVLEGRGAFTANRPRLLKFDAYGNRVPELGAIDFFVDDGPHTEPAIRNVLRLFGPMMASRSVYVVEDFSDGDRLLEAQFPDAHIIRAGRLNAACL